METIWNFLQTAATAALLFPMTLLLVCLVLKTIENAHHDIHDTED